jgi:hypothetical protein
MEVGQHSDLRLNAGVARGNNNNNNNNNNNMNNEA